MAVTMPGDADQELRAKISEKISSILASDDGAQIAQLARALCHRISADPEESVGGRFFLNDEVTRDTLRWTRQVLEAVALRFERAITK